MTYAMAIAEGARWRPVVQICGRVVWRSRWSYLNYGTALATAEREAREWWA